ncbi:hypothetical protein H5410_055843, partial [Solanum commersonii]
EGKIKEAPKRFGRGAERWMVVEAVRCSETAKRLGQDAQAKFHGNRDKRTFHLLRWSSLTLDKKRRGYLRGGLVVWAWDFHVGGLIFTSEEHALWKEVKSVKYGSQGFWTTKVVTSPYGASLWRSIRALWQNIVGNIGFVATDGRMISFFGMITGLGNIPQRYIP